MCFIVPAIVLGGLTIVVEPLRALIDSLLGELRNRNIRCEKLLTVNDAKGYSKKLAAADRLQYLCRNWSNRKSTRVIVTTPELIYRDSSMQSLVRLMEKGSLKRIVIDEFDLWCVQNRDYDRIACCVLTRVPLFRYCSVEEGTRGSSDTREAYALIVPKIRKFLPDIPT